MYPCVHIFDKIPSMKRVIIIPTYNEKENIVPLIQEIFKQVPDIFIMVVDDNSPDGTAQAVRELQRSYLRVSLLVRERKEGLGKAYIHALSEVMKDAEVSKIIMMDADFSHDPACLPLLLKQAERFDVVIGSRYVPGGKTVGWELWRRILSFGGNLYCRLITRMPVADCTSWFGATDARILRKIDFSNFDVSGYAFTIELKYALWKAGATFVEVPIIFTNRTGGESKISNHIVYEGILAPWKMILRKHRS